jgi:signal transduction histidine kinase
MRGPGVGLVWNGQVTFSSSPCADFCNKYRDKTGVERCAAFYRELDERASVAQVKCPAGFDIAYASLSKSTKEISHMECSSNPDPSTLAIGVKDFGRREKKSAVKLLRTLPQWTNPTEGLIDGLSLLQSHIEQHREAQEDRVFNQTLVQYKDFVASFSHEALSPIQEVRVLLERAESRTTDVEGRSLISRGIRALDKVRTSLEGMRLLFNPDQKLIANQFQSINLRSMVAAWCEIYAEEIAAKNLRLVFDPPWSNWDVRGVKEYVEVLVRNLVSNAVKYSFDGTGRADSKLIFRFGQGKKITSFVVVSFGVPIPIQDIANRTIFALSKRAHTANDRGRTGRGVGLYLVDLIAKQHGGEVNAHSEVLNPGRPNEVAKNEFTVTFRR